MAVVEADTLPHAVAQHEAGVVDADHRLRLGHDAAVHVDQDRLVAGVFLGLVGGDVVGHGGPPVRGEARRGGRAAPRGADHRCVTSRGGEWTGRGEGPIVCAQMEDDGMQRIVTGICPGAGCGGGYGRDKDSGGGGRLLLVRRERFRKRAGGEGCRLGLHRRHGEEPDLRTGECRREQGIMRQCRSPMTIAKVSYAELMRLFFRSVDPTDARRAVL